MRNFSLAFLILFTSCLEQSSTGAFVPLLNCEESILEEQYFSVDFATSSNPYDYSVRQGFGLNPMVSEFMMAQRELNCQERFAEEMIVEAGFPAWDMVAVSDLDSAFFILPFFHLNSRQVPAFQCARKVAEGWDISLFLREDVKQQLLLQEISEEYRRELHRTLAIFEELDRYIFDEDEFPLPSGYGVRPLSEDHPCAL